MADIPDSGGAADSGAGADPGDSADPVSAAAPAGAALADRADPGSAAPADAGACRGDTAGPGSAAAPGAGAGPGDTAGPGEAADPGGSGASGDGSTSPAPAARDTGGNGGGGSGGPAGGGNAGGGDAGGGGGAGPGAAGSEGPAELLGEARAIRRRARRARHAYWFPLVLFGLLACASVPFYIQNIPTRSGTYPIATTPGPRALQSVYLGGFGLMRAARGLPYYWLGAMLLGITASVFWYRWRGNRVGLRTAARGYLITGLVIIALALLLPLAPRISDSLSVITPGDLLIRGTFPFVLIGLGLCYLVWAERSVGLAIIAALYLAISLVASLYDLENLYYYAFGSGISPDESALPNVLLPTVVLLLSGAGAWLVQRRQRAPALQD